MVYSVHAKIRKTESVKMAQTLEFGRCDFSDFRMNRVYLKISPGIAHDMRDAMHVSLFINLALCSHIGDF